MFAEEADHLLVSRIRQGDTEAWNELIRRFEGRLLAFVESRLGEETAAEDVVQETFLGFLLSLPNYDETTPLESYLFAIAAHKLTDSLRRQGRRPALSVAQSASNGGSAEPAGAARHASSLLRSGERRQREEHLIAETLGDLVQKCQDQGQWNRLKCLELLFVRGWPNKRVAETLGISEQAVANHKQFAVGKLQEAAARAGVRGLELPSNNAPKSPRSS